MEIDEKEVERLTESYVRKWVASLRARGRNPTSEGIKRYRESARLLARIRVEMSRRKEENEEA